jgi:hypothetical protein
VTDYLVYEARFLDPSTGRLTLYIGRTSRTLKARQGAHRRDPTSPLYPYLRSAHPGLTVEWRVVWTGPSFKSSMDREILEIRRAKGTLRARCLNRTRGGWYDQEDAGVKVRREIRKRRRRREKENKAKGWLTPPSLGR